MGHNDQNDQQDPHKDEQPEAGSSAAGDVVATTEGKVATREDNLALEHSVDGITTRSDLTDAGVPMLPGSPDEPVGPEDAFGAGPKRGLYAPRELEAHTTVELIPEDEREPDGPRTRLVDQVARAADQGDAPGKGGVPGTAPREAV